MNELVYLKEDKVDLVLDKVSVSDWFAAAALLVVKESDGPNLLKDMYYGRADVTHEAELGDVNMIPNA